MMGTLATVLAGKKIQTQEENYSADVEGEIENIDNVLKITRIKVNYNLKAPKDKADDAKDALVSYLQFCPAAQSVIGCIKIEDQLNFEELAG